MHHYTFKKYLNGKLKIQTIRLKTKIYKNFLKNAIRLSICSQFYWYKGRFYENYIENSKVYLMLKNNNKTKKIEQRFIYKGLLKSKKIVVPKLLTRFDLLDMS